MVSYEAASFGLLEPIRWLGDVLGRSEEASRFTTLIDSPVWRSVPAVASGNVAYLDVQEANGNYGLAGVQAALDDLTTQLE